MSSMTLRAPQTRPTSPTTPTAPELPPSPACASDPEVMFPAAESSGPGKRTEGEQRALAVCARCPVLAPCRRAVLDTLDSAPMPYGVAGGMTREDRRAIRAARRKLTSVAGTAEPAVEQDPDTSGASERAAVTAAPIPQGPALVTVDVLDEQVHAAITAHPQVADVVDPATVRALVEARGPEWASRWEVALAAVVLLARRVTVTATARALGEEYIQVKRWRERRDSGEALVAGERGAVQMLRPARLVGPQPPVAVRPGREARTRGAA